MAREPAEVLLGEDEVVLGLQRVGVPPVEDGLRSSAFGVHEQVAESVVVVAEHRLERPVEGVQPVVDDRSQVGGEVGELRLDVVEGAVGHGFHVRSPRLLSGVADHETSVVGCEVVPFRDRDSPYCVLVHTRSDRLPGVRCETHRAEPPNVAEPVEFAEIAPGLAGEPFHRLDR